MVRSLFITGLLAASLAACGGPPGSKFAFAPREADDKLAEAMREEAEGDPSRAIDRYLALAEVGAKGGEDGAPLLVGALDALVFRRVIGLERVSSKSALAFRSARDIRASLQKIADNSEGPFARGLIADALLVLANDAGDEAAATKSRGALACATEATVFGPLEARAFPEGTETTDAALDGPLPLHKESKGVFPYRAMGEVTKGRGCDLLLTTTSSTRGPRDIYFDVAVAEAGTVALSLTTNARAEIAIGSAKTKFDRSVTLGAHLSEQFFLAQTEKAGALRIRVRAAIDSSSDQVRLSAYDANGRALKITAPLPSSVASVKVVGARRVKFQEESAILGATNRSKQPQSVLVNLLAGLALGFDRQVEAALAPEALRTSAPLDLVYARALGVADDLSPTARMERARTAFARVNERWKAAWEPKLALAMLQGERKGGDAEMLEVLEALDKSREGTSENGRALFDALDSQVSFSQSLRDRAKEKRESAKKKLDGSRFYAVLDLRATEVTSARRAKLVCEAKVMRDSMECRALLRAIGDKPAARAELERLRRLFGSPLAFIETEIGDLLADGDVETAKKRFELLPAGARSIGVLAATSTPIDSARVLELAPFVVDGTSISAALGPSFKADFPDQIARVREAIAKSGNLTNTSTVVLDHDERYALSQNGVLHFFVYDLRRVGGTTDVEDNAAVDLPYVDGRVSTRTLRRRVFKVDGRVIEPERNPGAQQTHADLAQLEAGDSVEALYEGWAIPDETGQLGFDTPDLLPARTSVQKARISVSLPAGIEFSAWQHPSLGKPEVSGNERVWTLKNVEVRRIDQGTPMMERSVGVSVTTLRWSDVARDLRERLALMEGTTQDFTAWMQTALAGTEKAKNELALVEAIVKAAGKAIREANSSGLVGNTSESSQSVTSRTYLSSRTGSRSFVIREALRASGIPADVALSETEPFSSNPNFPAHRERFRHPFVIAMVKNDSGARNPVWIDADVAGPPLPPGKVTPELRGRAAIFSDGRIAEVPRAGNEDGQRDDLEVHLKVGDRKESPGEARGDVKVTLRGRSAQALASMFERAVGHDREQSLREAILGVIPNASVDKVELLSEEESSEISIRGSIRVANLAEKKSDAKGKTAYWVLGTDPVHQTYPRGRTATLSSTFASQGTRDSALSVTRGLSYHLKWTIEFPEGATVVAPPSFERSGRAFTGGETLVAKRTSKSDKNVLVDEFILEVPPATVSAEGYAAFAKLCREIDAGFLRSASVTF